MYLRKLTHLFGGTRALEDQIDEFFDKVMVNAEEAELRANRLRLLSAIGNTLGQVADFSRIES